MNRMCNNKSAHGCTLHFLLYILKLAAIDMESKLYMATMIKIWWQRKYTLQLSAISYKYRKRNNKLFYDCDAQMLLSLTKVVAKDYVAGLHVVSLFNIDTLMVFLTYFCLKPIVHIFCLHYDYIIWSPQWCNQRSKIVLPSDNYGFCD